MRTTLDIEDDVLQAAKEIAVKDGTTAGKVISSLARRGLRTPSEPGAPKFEVKNGVPIFPSRGDIITMEKIKRIMDEEGI